ADRAGQLADAARLERAREPVAVAVELERPPGELPAERCRFRLDAVRAADADRAPVFLGPRDHRAPGPVGPAPEARAAVADPPGPGVSLPSPGQTRRSAGRE